MRASTVEKKKRIIEVATELFIEHGYKDTSLDQIVAVCGGSKQTLYRYFGNKEGLLTEVMAYHTSVSLEEAFKLSDSQHLNVAEALEGFGLKYIKGLCADPLLSLFRIVAADFHKNQSVTESFWLRGPQRIHGYLIEYLQSDAVQQQLSITNPQLACAQLLALIKLDYQTTAMLGHELPDDNELKITITQAVAAFISLYKKV
ncbi:hypothetical protein EQ875_00262 [Photobacterium damselae subsp. damselae]|uniref:TetR/AcrR family transcriptional regulator n=1 Tax=Photobacterium damselae TaxID=38293 RepID=UPI00109B8704|nr:TetR/AcrR family transcriptional regulator [Photobacterium damselae]TGZ36483.1 hypothetical protein EQ875_00262 [Photobacterium damselae subsp. damselae]